MTEAEAEAMLAELTKHYRCPVMPVSRYCKALETWAAVYLDKFPSHRDAFSLVRIGIVKSNLLSRLIYGGEKLRTVPCPVHKGEWSGVMFEPCPHCASGHNVTGWLPEP